MLNVKPEKKDFAQMLERSNIQYFLLLKGHNATK